MNIRHSLVTMICSVALAQQAPPAAQAPGDSGAIIRTETKVVLVDAVVTDKKGNYIHDLTAKDFKVWEDNKEQTVTSFTFEADANSPTASDPRYTVLFFDNSTLDMAAQAQARIAAAKFLDNNAGPTRLMAVVNYGGSLQIAQNFTSDPERLKGAVKGVKFSSVSPNEGRISGLGRAAADFGVRDVVLALRSLAKNLGTVPGRKTLILFTGGFPVSNEMLPEVTATIDACNRANVAIYAIDGRGLVAPDIGGPPAGGRGPRGALIPPPFSMPVLLQSAFDGRQLAFAGPKLFEPAFFQARPPGGGSPPGGGGTPGGGRPGGGTAPPVGGGSPPGGGSRPPAGGVPTNPNPTRPGTFNTPFPTTNRGLMNPVNQPRNLIPRFPDSASTNQNVMYMLAQGTGGFVIVNTNDLLGGLEKIGKEQNQYYLLGYTPPQSDEGTCHTLRVKVEHGANVRARSGYCNSKSRDLLAKTPVEKTLETRAAASQPGNLPATMQVPFFYTSANVARVNVAMEISTSDLKFEKEKGKMRAVVNILGLANRPDGSVGARFSDTQTFEFENKKEVEAFKEKPYHYENQFDVATGKYALKVVFSAGGDNFGKVEMPLTVDPYDGKELSVSSLALSTNLRRAADTSGSLDAALIEDRTPLIAGGVQVFPSGSNRFKSADKAIMYFELYEPLLTATQEPGAKPLAVALQLRVLDGKTGAEKSDSGLFRIELPAKSANTALPLAMQVPLEKLTPGMYNLELQALDNAGGKTKRVTAFEVQ